MSKRRQHSELVWVTPNAGFGAGGAFGTLQPEIPFPIDSHGAGLHHNTANRQPARSVTEHVPCLLDCPDPLCREWATVWLLPGNTRPEAVAHLIARRYSGAAYHVSECEMLDRPGQYQPDHTPKL